MIDTEKTYLHALFERAEETPDKIWMQEVDGDELTFAQSRDLALRWADALGQLGVGEGDMVATLMENCLDSQHVWLGAALVRAVEVPLSPLLRGESLVHALNDSRSKVVVVAEPFAQQIEDVSGRLNHLERVVVLLTSKTMPESAFETVSREDLIGRTNASVAVELPNPGDIACVLYTSGTTGPSKGTLIPWGQLNANAVSADVSRFGDSEAFYYNGAANHAGARSQPPFNGFHWGAVCHAARLQDPGLLEGCGSLRLYVHHHGGRHGALCDEPAANARGQCPCIEVRPDGAGSA